MKTKDVVVGKVYKAKVSGRTVPVKVVAVRPDGRLMVVNLSTNRSLVFRSARRLRTA